MTNCTVDAIDTPAMLVDETVVHRNLTRMAEKVTQRGMVLVPHTKTHKSPHWAKRQIALGAERVMVAKLGEADVLLSHGILDQYVGYPLVGDIKAHHLTELIHRGLKPMVAVDSPASVDLLASVAAATGYAASVLIEVDTGFGRCGLAVDADVVELARYAEHVGVRCVGITCFGGHITWRAGPDGIRSLVAAEDKRMSRVAAALTRVGLAPDIVSQGGTVIAGYMEETRTATEMRPGIYIYNDVGTVMAGAAAFDDCAAVVLTSVVSIPSRDRAVVDAGSKSLAGDGPVMESFGYIRERPDLRVSFLSEEHGVVVSRVGGPTGLRIGQRLTVVPNHVCTMVNLHDAMVVQRSGLVIDTLPVAARGAIR